MLRRSAAYLEAIAERWLAARLGLITEPRWYGVTTREQRRALLEAAALTTEHAPPPGTTWAGLIERAYARGP